MFKEVMVMNDASGDASCNLFIVQDGYILDNLLGVKMCLLATNVLITGNYVAKVLNLVTKCSRGGGEG